jgi:negative regulator of flagellin synthesis FlgM
MKIGQLDIKPVPPAAAAERKPPAAAASSVEASAQVQLSPAASTLGSQPSEAVVDVAKVERIKQAIAAGTFKVNPEQIANKLVESATELLGRKPG